MEVRKAVKSYYFSEGDISFQSDDEWYFALGWTIQYLSRKSRSSKLKLKVIWNARTLESARTQYMELFTRSSKNMHLDERANKLISAVCIYQPEKWIINHPLMLGGATDLHLTKR